MSKQNGMRIRITYTQCSAPWENLQLGTGPLSFMWRGIFERREACTSLWLL